MADLNKDIKGFALDVLSNNVKDRDALLNKYPSLKDYKESDVTDLARVILSKNYDSKEDFLKKIPSVFQEDLKKKDTKELPSSDGLSSSTEKPTQSSVSTSKPQVEQPAQQQQNAPVQQPVQQQVDTPVSQPVQTNQEAQPPQVAPRTRGGGMFGGTAQAVAEIRAQQEQPVTDADKWRATNESITFIKSRIKELRAEKLKVTDPTEKRRIENEIEGHRVALSQADAERGRLAAEADISKTANQKSQISVLKGNKIDIANLTGWVNATKGNTQYLLDLESQKKALEYHVLLRKNDGTTSTELPRVQSSTYREKRAKYDELMELMNSDGYKTLVSTTEKMNKSIQQEASKIAQAYTKGEAYKKFLTKGKVAKGEVDVPDMEKVIKQVESISDALGVGDNKYFKEVLKNQIKGELQNRIILPQVENLYEQNKDVQAIKEKYQSKANDLNLEFEKLNNKASAISDNVTAELTAKYEPQSQQLLQEVLGEKERIEQAFYNDVELQNSITEKFNKELSENKEYQQITAKYRNLISSGELGVEEAQNQFKEETEELRRSVSEKIYDEAFKASAYGKQHLQNYDDYKEKLSGYNSVLLSERNKEVARRLQSVKKQWEALKNEYSKLEYSEEDKEKLGEIFNKIYGDVVKGKEDELRKLQDDASYLDRGKALLLELLDIASMNWFAKKSRDVNTSLALATKATIGGIIENAGISFGSSMIETLGARLSTENVFMPAEENKKWKDYTLAEHMIATGTLLGSMPVYQATGALATFATVASGGTAPLIAVGLSSVVGFLTDSILVGSDAYHQAIAEGKSEYQATVNRKKMFDAQFQNLGWYALQLLPLGVGKASRAVAPKFMRGVNGLGKGLSLGALSTLNDASVQTMLIASQNEQAQSLSEDNELSGRGMIASSEAVNESLKNVFLPTIFTGGIGGIGGISRNRKTKKAISNVVSSLDVNTQIMATPFGEKAKNQFLFNITNSFGVDGAVTASQLMYEQGFLTKEEYSNAINTILEVQKIKEQGLEAGLKQNQLGVYNALVTEINKNQDLLAKAETEGNTVNAEIFKAKIKELQNQLTAFSTSGEVDMVVANVKDHEGNTVAQYLLDLDELAELRKNKNTELLISKGAIELGAGSRAILTTIQGEKGRINDLIRVRTNKVKNEEAKTFTDSETGIRYFKDGIYTISSEDAKTNGKQYELNGNILTDLSTGEEVTDTDYVSDILHNAWFTEAEQSEQTETTNETVETAQSEEANVSEGELRTETTQSEMPDLGRDVRTLRDLNGKNVRYRGEIGTLRVDDGGKVEIETDTNVYEMGNDANENALDKGVEAIDDVQALSENTVTVDGKGYNVTTDDKGNVISLNSDGETITDENILIRADIARNIQLDNIEVERQVKEKPQKVVEVVNEVEPNTRILDTILSFNLSEEVDNAIDDLADGNPITESQALATEMYVHDAIERLDRIEKERPELSEHIERVRDYLFTISDLLDELKDFKDGKRTEKSSSKDAVQQPKRRTEKRSRKKTTTEPKREPIKIKEDGRETNEVSEAKQVHSDRGQKEKAVPRDRGTEKTATDREIAEKERELEQLKSEGVGLERVGVEKTENLTVRPDLFQYKSIDNSESGTNKSERLKGKFNRNLAGTILVWKDTNGEVGEKGKVYVVDGHHRVDFANRSGEKEMSVFYIDADTAQEARLEGAKANIAQGRGTAIDAGKVFRDSTADQLEGFEPTSLIARQGLALSKLSDGLFDLVAQGKLTINNGVTLSRGDTHEIQEQVYKGVPKDDKGFKWSNEKVSQLIDIANNAGEKGKVQVTQMDLFGTSETEKIDLETRLDVLTAITAKLKKDKNIFGATAKNAERLAELEGNVIDAEANLEISEEAKRNLMIFDRLKHTSEFAPALDNAVEQYQKAKNNKEKRAVIDDLYEQVKVLAEREMDALFGEKKAEPKVEAKETPKPETPKTEPPKTVNKPKNKEDLSSILQDKFNLPKDQAEAVSTVIDQMGEALVGMKAMESKDKFYDMFPSVESLTKEQLEALPDMAGQVIGNETRGLYKRGINIIANVGEKGNATTAIHEISHWVLDVLQSSNSEEAKKAIEILRAGAMSKNGKAFAKDGGYKLGSREHLQEYFAWGLEKYLAGEKLPENLNGLEAVYAKIKDIFIGLYHAIVNDSNTRLGRIQLNDSMKDLYARILNISREELNTELAEAEAKADEAKPKQKSEVDNAIDWLDNLDFGGEKPLFQILGEKASLKVQERENEAKLSEREAIEREYAEIEAKAKSDGTWLKAPNGKDTNLTPRQWLQVRTKNFAAWFGDWINDPQNASKVVDENGEPLVVYHGSPNVFTEFSLDDMGRTGTALGQGHYFTNTKKTALIYSENGGVVYSTFLNIRTLLSNDSLTITKKELKEILKKIDEAQYEDGEHYFLSNYDDVGARGVSNVLNEAVALEYESNENDVELIGGLINASGDVSVVFKALKEVKGFTGSINNIDGNETHYVVGLSNQIKSATDNVGTFSNESNDILFQNSSGSDRVRKGVRDLSVRVIMNNALGDNGNIVDFLMKENAKMAETIFKDLGNGDIEAGKLEAQSIFNSIDVETARSLLDVATFSYQPDGKTSEARYITRAIETAKNNAKEELEEVLKLGSKQSKTNLAEAEKQADIMFNKMAMSENPDAMFLGMFSYFRNSLGQIATSDNGGVQMAFFAQFMHKVIHHYRQAGDYQRSARWEDMNSRLGRSSGTYLRAMSEGTTPEALANRLQSHTAKYNADVIEKMNTKEREEWNNANTGIDALFNHKRALGEKEVEIGSLKSENDELKKEIKGYEENSRKNRNLIENLQKKVDENEKQIKDLEKAKAEIQEKYDNRSKELQEAEKAWKAKEDKFIEKLQELQDKAKDKAKNKAKKSTPSYKKGRSKEDVQMLQDKAKALANMLNKPLLQSDTLLQDSGDSALNTAKTFISDILNSGVKTKDKALADFVSLLGEHGVDENSATDLFNRAWDKNSDKVLSDNLADRLADKVKRKVKSDITPNTPITDEEALLGIALTAKANEIVPKKTKESVKEKGKKTNPLEALAELVKNKKLSDEAWKKALGEAKNIVEANEVLTETEKQEIYQRLNDAVNNFMKNPLPESMARKAVKEGLDNMNKRLTDIIRQHYGKQEAIGQSLASKLVEGLGIDAETAELLQAEIMNEWWNTIGKEQERELEKIFGQLGVTVDKTNTKIDTAEKRGIDTPKLNALRDKLNTARERLDALNNQENLSKIEQTRKGKLIEEIKKTVKDIDAELQGINKVASRSNVQQIIDAVNFGALGNEAKIRAFQDKFGFTTLTEEQKARINKYARLLSQDIGIHIGKKWARNFADEIEGLRKTDAKQVYDYLYSVIITSLLTGITTMFRTIPAGTFVMASERAFHRFITNSFSSLAFAKHYFKAGLGGSAIKSSIYTLKTGHDVTDNVSGLLSDNDDNKVHGSLQRQHYRQMFKDIKSVWTETGNPLKAVYAPILKDVERKMANSGDKTKMERAFLTIRHAMTSAYTLSASLPQVSMPFNMMFDTGTRNFLGEMFNFIKEYNDLVAKQSKSKGIVANNTLSAMKDRVAETVEAMGYNEFRDGYYREKAEQIAENVRRLGGYEMTEAEIQSEAKLQMMADREQSNMEEAYMDGKNASMMGDVDGFVGVLHNLLFKQLIGVKSSDSTGKLALKAIPNMTIGLFSRIAAQSAHFILEATPILNILYGGIFSPKKNPKTGKYDIWRTPSKQQYKELLSRNILYGSIAYILINHMLNLKKGDNDDDDNKDNWYYELNPDALIKITKNRDEKSGWYRGSHDKGYEPMSFQIRTSSDKEFGEPIGHKLALFAQPYLTPLGSISDALTMDRATEYQEEKGTEFTRAKTHTPKIKYGDLWRYFVSGGLGAVKELSFAGGIRTVESAINAASYAIKAENAEANMKRSKKEALKVLDGVLSPLKQLIPLNSAFTNAMASIYAQESGNEELLRKYRQSVTERVVLRGWQVADVAYQLMTKKDLPTMIDRFGQPVSRKTSLNMIYAYYNMGVDVFGGDKQYTKDQAEYDNQLLNRVITANEGIYIQDPLTVGTKQNIMGGIFAQKGVKAEQINKVDDVLATKWGELARDKFTKNGKEVWEKMERAEIAGHFMSSRREAMSWVSQLGVAKVKGMKGDVEIFYNLYKYEPELFYEIYPELKDKIQSASIKSSGDSQRRQPTPLQMINRKGKEATKPANKAVRDAMKGLGL